jgi:hypothetical protein
MSLIPVKGKRFLLSLKHTDWLYSPLSLMLSGYWGSFLRGKVANHKADHSPPSTAETKNEWSVPVLLCMSL